jgi:hypothetical protein
MAIFKVNFPKIDFHPEVFDNLITERGVTIQWEKAAMCPCVRADQAGRTIFNCGECHNGNIYVAQQDITAVVTNVTGQRNAAIWGDLALGGIFVTTYGQNRFGINDRIVLKNSVTRYAELCVLGRAKVKTAAAPGDTTLTLDHTRKLPSDGATVLRVSVGGQVVSYTDRTSTTLTGIPASGPGAITAPIAPGTDVVAMAYKTRYAPQTMVDFRTTETVYVPSQYTVQGDLILFTTVADLPPSNFTLLYEAYPAYLVDSLSHEYRDQMLKLGYKTPQLARLPIAAVCRRDFLNVTR